MTCSGVIIFHYKILWLLVVVILIVLFSQLNFKHHCLENDYIQSGHNCTLTIQSVFDFVTWSSHLAGNSHQTSKSCRWQDGIQFCECHTDTVDHQILTIAILIAIAVWSWPCSGCASPRHFSCAGYIPHLLTQQHITQHFAIHLSSCCTMHSLLPHSYI